MIISLSIKKRPPFMQRPLITTGIDPGTGYYMIDFTVQIGEYIARYKMRTASNNELHSNTHASFPGDAASISLPETNALLLFIRFLLRE